MSVNALILIVLLQLRVSSQQPLTVTRFPSIRNFVLDGRVTVSGVEIRFSDPKLPPVHAVYGLRYASLGGEGDSATAGPGTAESREPCQQAAKRRFMHSVAAFIYETPARGHLQKTGPPPECPQPPRVSDYPGEGWTGKTAVAASALHLHQHPHPATQAEDCLTLNIFVPETGAESANERTLPVLIFVHGDSYEHGSGNAYDFSLFSSLGDVVVVTLNYRLGLLGFLSDSSAGSTRSNFALFDLQAAIQWVHSNIRRFGGDPERVTLMGHSHGAALVHLFATSMLSIGPNYYGIKGLVLFDGSADAPWATASCNTDIKSLVEAAFQAPRSPSPSPPPSASLFDLLQDLPISSILEIQRNLSRLGLERCYSPLPRKQEIVAERPSLFNRVSLLYGQTEFAGALFYPHAPVAASAHRLAPALAYLLERVFRVSAYPLDELLKYVYTESDALTADANNDEEVTKIQEIFTDALFWSPALETLRDHERGQEANSGPNSWAPSRYVVHFSGATYGDDLNLLLGAPFVSTSQGPGGVERPLSQSLIQYVANFVHFGDPNKRFAIPNVTENLPTLWPAFNARDELSLRLNKPISTFNAPLPPDGVLDVVSAHRRHYTTFWTEIFPKLADDSRRMPQPRSSTFTHFVVPAVAHKGPGTHDATTMSPNAAEETPSGRPFGISNESVEFPSLYVPSQNPPSVPRDGRDDDKKVLLLTIVVGLTLFLLNIVFTATFYFCHQQRKGPSNGILIEASEADQGGKQDSQAPKQSNEMLCCRQPVKLPAFGIGVEAPFQSVTADRQKDFHSVALRTQQRSPSRVGHVYPPGGSRTISLSSHRFIAPFDSNWQDEINKRPSVSMI